MPRAGGPSARSGGAAKPGMTGGAAASGAAVASRSTRKSGLPADPAGGAGKSPVESVLKTSDLKRSDIEPVRPLFVSSSLRFVRGAGGAMPNAGPPWSDGFTLRPLRTSTCGPPLSLA